MIFTLAVNNPQVETSVLIFITRELLAMLQNLSLIDSAILSFKADLIPWARQPAHDDDTFLSQMKVGALNRINKNWKRLPQFLFSIFIEHLLEFFIPFRLPFGFLWMVFASQIYRSVGREGKMTKEF